MKSEDLDRHITGNYGTEQEQAVLESEQEIADRLYSAWNAEQGIPDPPRDDLESLQRLDRLSSEGVPVPAVPGIMRALAKQNKEQRDSRSGWETAGYHCPLCGVRYYYGERYTVPPAVSCSGCKGDSLRGKILSRLFCREMYHWDLEELTELADLIGGSNPAVHRILNRIEILEEQRDRFYDTLSAEGLRIYRMESEGGPNEE
jgi:hypothetical protein